MLCDPITLSKVFVYQVPSNHLGVAFREFLELIDENGQVALFSKHMATFLSFRNIEMGKIGGGSCVAAVVEREVPAPMFLVGKDISI